MVQHDTLLSTSEAARAAGVSAETIRKWAQSGRLPAQVTPLGLLINPPDLHQLLRERRTAGRLVSPRAQLVSPIGIQA